MCHRRVCRDGGSICDGVGTHGRYVKVKLDGVKAKTKAVWCSDTHPYQPLCSQMVKVHAVVDANRLLAHHIQNGTKPYR